MAQIHEAQGIMALHQSTPDGRCARCRRVGLDHAWPCGPYERAAEIAHGPGRRRAGILLQSQQPPDSSP